MAEPFVWDLCPRNHVLDEGPGPPREGALLRRHVPAVGNVPTVA